MIRTSGLLRLFFYNSESSYCKRVMVVGNIVKCVGVNHSLGRQTNGIGAFLQLGTRGKGGVYRGRLLENRFRLLSVCGSSFLVKRYHNGRMDVTSVDRLRTFTRYFETLKRVTCDSVNLLRFEERALRLVFTRSVSIFRLGRAPEGIKSGVVKNV